MAFHGPCLVKLGRYPLAKERLMEAYARMKETGQQGHVRMRAVVGSLVELAERSNLPGEAERWAVELRKLPATTAPAGRAE
jgi:hypothetical protein